jgi:hypothetical protein
MFARLIAKAIMAAAGIAMAFFGVGLLAMALASALAKTFGVTEAYALAGAVLLVPPLIWVTVKRSSRPKKRPAAAENELTRVLLGAVAKDTPWVAIIGAGLIGAANMFLNRKKPPK